MAWVNIEDLVAQQQVRIVTLWRLKCLGRGTGFEFKFASLIRAALSSNEATLHSAP